MSNNKTDILSMHTVEQTQNSKTETLLCSKKENSKIIIMTQV